MTTISTDKENTAVSVENCDGIEYLFKMTDNSVHLVLTDPPYIISKDSGMNKHYNQVKHNEYQNVKYVKSEEQWEAYKKAKSFMDSPNRVNTCY